MKTNEYDINDFYFHDKDGYKLNPKGMALICHYYRKKHGLSNLFVAANYNKLESLIENLLPQSNDARFGVVYRNIPKQGIGFSHKCAVIIQGNIAIILDPFGGAGGNINFARMGAEHIRYVLEEKLEKSDVKIYTPRLKVQSDASSCSTLCFLFLKEALRMGDELIHFLCSASSLLEEDDLPPNLAKYTQNILYLDNLKQNGLLNKYPSHNSYKIPIRSIKRQQATNKKTETLLQYVRFHQSNQLSQTNPVAAERAGKHIHIINQYLETLTLDELEKILQETSNPTEQPFSTINKFFPIDDLTRTEKVCKKLRSNSKGFDDLGFDVFSFLADDDVKAESAKLRL